MKGEGSDDDPIFVTIPFFIAFLVEYEIFDGLIRN